MRWFEISGVVLLASVVPACGGLEASNLFSIDGVPIDAGHDSSTVVFPPSMDAGHVVSHDAAIPDVGATTKDVVVVTVPEAAAPPPAMMSVMCPTSFSGGGTCSGPAPIECCVQQNNMGGGGPAATCDVPATPAACQASGGAAVQCAQTADCPAGDVCCGTKDNNGNYTTVECAASCSASQVQFCGQNSNDCGSQGTCVQSQILTQYTVCYTFGQ
jgi:hypothetical protein